MNDSASAQTPGKAEEAPRNTSQRAEAAAPAASALRDALAEAHETILLIDHALISTAEAKDGPQAPGLLESASPSSCGEDEASVQRCIELIRSEEVATVSLLQRRLRLGYGRAARIMDELERRQIVGPSKGAAPRDILVDKSTTVAGGEEPDDPYDALMRACASGDLAAVKTLVAAGLDVNYKGGKASPLHFAACNGHEPIARFLLERGAEVDPRLGTVNDPIGSDIAGATPLILARANGHDSVTALLVSRGANAHAKTYRGHTAHDLIQAIRRFVPGAVAIDLGLN